MPFDLLKCIICPKKPKFSDTSHLLTHVGSKGHLAHLHGLQVRAHQELDAAHQLGFYNQWYQEHGMAALLSERMLQKEHKRAIKKAANAARMSNTPITARVTKPRPTRAETISSSSLVDHNCTPIRAPRDSSYPIIPSSPPRFVSGEVAEYPLSTEFDFDVKASPGMPQLKGTQYPGMAMFDAAPEAQRRKRNQKKDSSVLRGLARNSAMVVPQETVSSTVGVVLKHRHMDDLENDSPVEGETLLRQPTPKRRRHTKPRAPRIKKEKIDKQPRRRPGRPRKAVETPSKGPGTSADEHEPSSFHLSPPKVEGRSNHISKARKTNAFAVYQDSSSVFGMDGPSDIGQDLYAEADVHRPQFVYPHSTWHRPEPESYDPFKLIRERFTMYSGMEEIGQGKENSNDGMLQTHINPLLFQTNSSNLTGVAGPASAVNRLNPIADNNLDPFCDNDTCLPARNPLMAALENLRTPKQESFECGIDHINALSTPYRQTVFSA